ncbi:addiction module protein [Marinicella gelatinilytica]|uniref:addiction module protein n=1 Tax=Marinicella gelatinilytica TaxID=2996017 RepID=UPI002260F5BC|nr:addiction module protein [Marinicella gelatinilytica]MCX7544493.1 addiction module protein [Marinicella gelatinilytica]
MQDTLIKKLSRLNIEDKITLVEALWDSIASDSDLLDLPEHHKNILNERLQSLDQDTQNGKSWDEIRKNYI